MRKGWFGVWGWDVSEDGCRGAAAAVLLVGAGFVAIMEMKRISRSKG